MIPDEGSPASLTGADHSSGACVVVEVGGVFILFIDSTIQFSIIVLSLMRLV